MLKEQIYNHHCNILDKLTTFDYKTAVKIYAELGNAPGVEPDNLYLYYRLIKDFNLKNIVEFGSGFSTLFFIYIAKQLKINFTSSEEQEKYYDLTIKLLNHYNFENEEYLELIENENAYRDYAIETADLIFIDASIDLRKRLLNSSYQLLQNIPFIIVDDYESLTEITSKFEELTNRRTFYVYNGSGRRNRLQYINYLEDANHTIRDYFLRDQNFYLQ